MRRNEDGRFIFSGAANSVITAIDAPFKAFLSEAPSAALQVVGGYISHVRENIDFHHIVRVGRASASVIGERRGDHYVTLATSTLEKLNILDVITADAAVSRVTSVFPAAEGYRQNEDLEIHPARFYLAGSHFDNLKIDGKLYPFHLGTARFAGNDGFHVESGEILHRPIFKDPSSEAEPPTAISIPQFGTIHLGEIDIFGSRVTLTMLRVELGCAYAGFVSGPTSSSNGNDAP